jgi:3-dehydroquinate dehydratase
MNDIKKLIEEINLREPKNYGQMKIEEVSKELHNTMEFEQNVLKKINSFENNHQDVDLIKYAKMICRNVIERETSLIQETYLKKIDAQYLNSK